MQKAFLSNHKQLLSHLLSLGNTSLHAISLSWLLLLLLKSSKKTCHKEYWNYEDKILKAFNREQIKMRRRLGNLRIKWKLKSVNAIRGKWYNLSVENIIAYNSADSIACGLKIKQQTITFVSHQRRAVRSVLYSRKTRPNLNHLILYTFRHIFPPKKIISRLGACIADDIFVILQTTSFFQKLSFLPY